MMASNEGRRFVFVGGGARSGKSRFALEVARRLGPRRTFVAPAVRSDDEMRARIARHQDERGNEFTTIEEPLAVPEALAAATDTDVVVVDCLTIWIGNLLKRKDDDARILAALDKLIAVVAARTVHVVLVSNEVGMGLVPLTPMGRRFRDLVGTAHRRLAPLADEVHFAALGMLLRLCPGPVEAHVVGSAS
jgi:adenosylcobinamide kinase/adenosylcobinamide-phosphate guanylyltransferase